MSLITRLFGRKDVEERSSFDEIWQHQQNAGALSKAGQSINSDTAMRVSAVNACVRVLAETIASLPIFVFKRTPDNGKEPNTKHHIHTLLHDKPNEQLTSFEFRELMMVHMGLRGNFYAIKDMNRAGKITRLIQLNPANMEVMAAGGFITEYKYTWEGGDTQSFTPEQIWHVKNLSLDGIIGASPVTLARESMGLSLATEEYGARLFSNDARPGGLLEHPGKISEDAAKRLKSSWQAAHSGGANSHKTAVLEEGLKWQAIGFSNDDSQFLETRGFQVEDIARIYRVPPILIGHSNNTSTFASAEQFFQSFVTNTIRPWAVRIEQSANKHLLSDRDRKNSFVEFKLDGLLRGDTLSRFEAYGVGRLNKWLSANDVRRLENMNPLGPEGDVYENPNIAVTKEAPEEPLVEDE